MSETDCTEVWRDVVGYEGLYKVSNLGRVCSFGRINRFGEFWRKRIMKAKSLRAGYLRIRLSKEGKAADFSVHRLVLDAFAGLCPEGMECRHLDGNPANNHLVNLCWGSFKDNEADKKIHGTVAIGERNGCAKLTESEAKIIKYSPEPQRKIALRFGVTQALVSLIRTGQKWKHI